MQVLITAGASGIGLAIARRFRVAGADVTVWDINADAIAALATSDPEIATAQVDVGDAEAVDIAFAAVDRLDVLVNNAGIGGGRGPVELLDNADWARTLAVNLSGPFYMIKQAARRMKAQKSGSILNISTSSVTVALPLRTPYVATKSAVQGMTRALARELGPHNIRVNAILPGLIANDRGRALVERLASERGVSPGEIEASFLRYISMRCWIDMDEIGDLAVFLASDRARHITGQAIAVDGGAEWEE
jgi:NAD(P)-dependent dehydrogenase (short-subunit alcohol dehydrogenase family)